jgi:hypothetical protein
MSVTCKYCKESGLYWEEDWEGRWRLCDPTRQRHRCDRKKLEAISQSRIKPENRAAPIHRTESRRPADTDLHRKISDRLNRSSGMFPQ